MERGEKTQRGMEFKSNQTNDPPSLTFVRLQDLEAATTTGAGVPHPQGAVAGAGDEATIRVLLLKGGVSNGSGHMWYVHVCVANRTRTGLVDTIQSSTDVLVGVPGVPDGGSIDTYTHIDMVRETHCLGCRGLQTAL